MRSKRAILAIVFVLGAVVSATAEVALDEVVQAGRFVLYRDHADPHKYYYIPDAPRLATKRDGTPEFTFIKYSKTDGATKGGIIHFLVTWGMTEGELSSAESALRLKDTEAKIAGPVPFKEGTFKVVSATAGEGGLFNRKIVGEGKAPIMPGQKAAVSIALTEEGASLLWESFKNPTSDVSVLFALKFAGVTPAFQAKLKVNWDKVYTQHDIKLHAEGTIKVVKLQADVRAILESLRQQGAIQLDVVGENESMQKMLDAVYGHLITLMCDKVPVGPEEATSPPAKKRPVPAPAPVGGRPDVHPAWSMSAVAGVVRAADERLRGGPFWDQQQDSWIEPLQRPPCDAQALARSNEYKTNAVLNYAKKDYLAAADLFDKAWAACPVREYLYWVAKCYDEALHFVDARTYFQKFIAAVGIEINENPDHWKHAQLRITQITKIAVYTENANRLFNEGKFAEAAELWQKIFESTGAPFDLFFAGMCYEEIGRLNGDLDAYKQAIELYDQASNGVMRSEFLTLDSYMQNIAKQAQDGIERIQRNMAAAPQTPPAQVAATQPSLEAKRKADPEQAPAQQAPAAPCDAQSRAKAEELISQGRELLNAHELRQGADLLKKAYDTCPDVQYLFELGRTYDLFLNDFTIALQYYEAFLVRIEFDTGENPGRRMAEQRLAVLRQVHDHWQRGLGLGFEGRYLESAEEYRRAYIAHPFPLLLECLGSSLKSAGDQSGDKAVYQEALGALEEYVEQMREADPELVNQELVDMARRSIRELRTILGPDAVGNRSHTRTLEPAGGFLGPPTLPRDNPGLSQKSVEEERRAKRQQAQAGEQTGQGGAQAREQAQSAGAQAGTGTQQAGTTGAAQGTKPPGGQTQAGNTAGGQSQQGLSAGQAAKSAGTGGGTTPPSGQTPGAKPAEKAAAAKPAAAAPEVKPIVSVSLGYTFKRIKMSGNYEVDMRKRLREDRDIVMSGNIGGIYQKYGEDRRFFSVVSLDDPTFQERSVEVILDGQDAADFKSYINAVSVLFRKQRFSGPPMTGEVKFVDQQFAQSGNRQSFKYGRLNEASTEWLDYEYKPKWSLYGGVEWEGEWVKTSDSVLTLTPPVLRRRIEISVDEDNILKNGVKALAVQVKHSLYGKDILKEVVINYDKGDPLLADYTYMHEAGNLGYSYKVVWLFLDGREIQTDWMTKESPFIYAVFTKK